MKSNILYVDDELENTIVFEATFEDEFNVTTAQSANEALELVEQSYFPVVISDQRMPGGTGSELFAVLRERCPFSKRIILTAYSDAASMMDAINKGGVYQFVSKPWQRESLLSLLMRAVETHDLEVANSALRKELLSSQQFISLGQAAARIAHEIRNNLLTLPLVEHIQDDYSEDIELLRLAQIAQVTHERLIDLLDEVRAVVRCDPHDLTLHSVSLDDAMHELVSFLRYDHSVPHDQLALNIDERCTVRGNKIKLQQVLVNLIKNAAYAIRDREDGQIFVRLGQESDFALITVSDNGCGMDKDTIDRMWEPFYTTKGSEGTGLGLDICREIIQSHGGEIYCEAEVDVGSRFVIRLPHFESPITTELVTSEMKGLAST